MTESSRRLLYSIILGATNAADAWTGGAVVLWRYLYYKRSQIAVTVYSIALNGIRLFNTVLKNAAFCHGWTVLVSLLGLTLSIKLDYI